ncbi:MAG: hypothetical protein GF341_07185, partial [candidate division Zixibacteria bacterium]|nr:hypothetical protein [candidate division Zixibacteria bacterium]
RGCPWGDYDRDGDIDLYVSRYSNPNILYLQDGGSFTDVAAAWGVNLGGDTQGAVWLDYDNDGDLDLYVSAWTSLSNKLFRNDGDAFTDVTATVFDVANTYAERAGVVGDFNGDGYVDIYVCNRDQASKQNKLYLNSGGPANWIIIEAIGNRTFQSKDGSNAAAIGAQIRVVASNGIAQEKYVGEGGSYFASTQASIPVEFGLGDAALVDSIIVTWPDSLRSQKVLTDVDVNQLLEIRQDATSQLTNPTCEWFASSGLLPDESCPPWEYDTDPDLPDPVLTAEYLEIATTQTDPVRYYTQRDPLLRPTDSLTIEARMRFVSGGTSPSTVHSKITFTVSPHKGNRFWIGQDSVYLGVDGGMQSTAYVDTDDEFHTYRLEIDSLGPITVYQDNVLILTGSVYTDIAQFTPYRQINWGDGTSFAWGTSHWAYVKHSAHLAPLVTNLNDIGSGSLRAAIEQANASPEADTITFCVAGEIASWSPLPPLSDAGNHIYIDGYSAPGASWGNPTITLDGSALGSGSGLTITSDNNVVEGLIIQDFPDNGITVSGSATGNRLSGNLFWRNGLSIDLGDDGITPNDPGDGDTGANTLLNFPVFDSIRESATGDTFAVYGTAPPNAIVDLFIAAEYGHPEFIPETGTHGPAYQLIGSDSADGTGFFVVDSIVKPKWSVITATATDVNGNTSELSRNKSLAADPIRVSAYSTPQTTDARGVMFNGSPPVQVFVVSPPDSNGQSDSIGAAINTFGSRATYDSLFDYGEDTDANPDVRVTIYSPDTGIYKVTYTLIGDPGTYLTGIGIDGHQEVQQPVTFTAVFEEDTTTHHHAPDAMSRGDLDGSGDMDAVDLNILIDIIFFNGQVDPPELADLNCDGVPDAVDLNYMIDHIFFNGPKPCL